MAAAPCFWRLVIASDNEQSWEAHIPEIQLFGDPGLTQRLDGSGRGKGIDGDMRGSLAVFDGRADTKWVTKGGRDKLGTWVGYQLNSGAWVQGIRTRQFAHPGNCVPSFDVQYSPDGQGSWRTFWTASGVGMETASASRAAGPLPAFSASAPLSAGVNAPKCWRFRVAADNENGWEAHLFQIQLFSDHNTEERLSNFAAGGLVDGGSRHAGNPATNVFDGKDDKKWETKPGKEKIGTWAGVTLAEGAWVNSIMVHQFGHPGNIVPVFDVQYSADEDPADPASPARPWSTYWTASALGCGWSKARRDAGAGPPPRFNRLAAEARPGPSPGHASSGHASSENRAIALASGAQTARTKLGGAYLTRVVDSRMLVAMQSCLHTKGEWLGKGRDCGTHHETYTQLVLQAAWQIQHAVELGRYDLAKQEIQDQLECMPGTIGAVALNSKDWPGILGIRVDGAVNECLLVHGTKPESLSTVLSGGLNERFSTIKGLFGGGTYLADDAGKADQYCTMDAKKEDNALHKALYPDATEHPGNVFYVLVCKVLLGQAAVTLDARNLITGGSVFANAERRELAPVPKSDPAFSYHSLIAETGQALKRYRECVQFHSDRILASYLLAYRRVP